LVKKTCSRLYGTFAERANIALSGTGPVREKELKREKLQGREQFIRCRSRGTPGWSLSTGDSGLSTSEAEKIKKIIEHRVLRGKEVREESRASS